MNRSTLSPLRAVTSALALAFAATATAAAGGAAALEWPQFHGPAGAGIASGSAAAPVEFGPSQHVQWSLAVPGGHSSPCISGGRIYLAAADKAAKTLSTLCVDRAAGKLLWQRDRKVEKLEHNHAISNPATATPATDGNTIFVYHSSYGLTAYDPSGQEVWTHPLPLAVNRMGFGSGTSPIVTGGLVLLDVHAGPESHLLALRTGDGTVAWKAPTPLFNEGWSTPVVWTEGGEAMVGMLNAGRFTARRLKDGSEKWWIAGMPNQTCATPVASRGLLYLQGTGVLGERGELIPPPSFEEMIAKYDADKDGKIATGEIPPTVLVADRRAAGGAGNMGLRQFLMFGSGGKDLTFDRDGWQQAVAGFESFASGSFMTTRVMAVRTGGQGDVSGSAVVWSETKGVPEVPSPLLLGDRLYLVKSGGTAICRDAGTGKVVYEERLGAPGGYFASPVAAGGRIYVASDAGVVTVFAAGDSLRVLARNELKEPVLATPAVADGTLYIRTAGTLYAFR
jgi:outer membrane protein assembly factor BamB